MTDAKRVRLSPTSLTVPTGSSEGNHDLRASEIDEAVAPFLEVNTATLDTEALLRENQVADEEYGDDELPSTNKATTTAAAKKKQQSRSELALDGLLCRAAQYVTFLEDQLAPDEKGTLVGQPKCMRGGEMKSYQLEGYRWMVGLWENALNGILADEMGLGKTIQTIAFLSHLWTVCPGEWRVVVAPLSTLPNWIAELRKWAPDMPAIVYHGTKQERQLICQSLRNLKGKNVPVVVTTYEIVCRDRAALQAFQWKTLVVDEGHRLKNRNCRLIKELNALVGRSSSGADDCSRLLLTGTPLQNTIQELWSLLHFILPNVFNDLELFTSIFELDSAISEQHDLEQSVVVKLHRILRPFMMRRLKTQVERHLPPKLEMVVYVSATPAQQHIYESIRKGELAQLAKAVDAGDRRSFMNVVMQLRKAAVHPYLHFDPTDVAGSSHDTTMDIVEQSGKMMALDQLLLGLRAKGHKVLIFSQFTKMLDIIDDYLRFLRPDLRYCRLDGGTHFTERKELMHRFNEDTDCFAFLLSTRAGGVGINLTAADTVILFDSDWNPQMDAQAMDRAHRIGQQRPVLVVRLVTARTVEMSIIQRANAKRKLERVVCAKQATIATRADEAEISERELKDLLANDFESAVMNNQISVGEFDLGGKDVDDILLNRDGLFDGSVPRKGRGYEIVEVHEKSLIGSLREEPSAIA